MNHHDSHDEPKKAMNWSRVNQWLLWLGLAAAVAWLVLRHGAHLLEVSPFLLLLACPLMHVFGHGGHGSHAGHAGGNTERDRPASVDPRSAETPARRDPPPGGHVH